MKLTFAFVVLTFAASWLLWLAAAATLGWDFSLLSGPVAVGGPLYLLGVFAPAFVAVAVTAHAEGRAGVSSLLRQMIPAAVSVRWYAFAVGYFAAIKLGVAFLHRAAIGSWPAFTQESWLVMLAAVAFSTPWQAGEEIGWRAYLLPRLSGRVGLPAASLIVGVIWACWHLPFFFFAGADKSGQPFAPYLLGVIALSVAMAWLYWRTGGSLLLTMVMHAAVNNLNFVPTPVSTSTHVFAVRASFVAWGTAALLWLGALFFLFAMRKHQRPARAVAAAGLALLLAFAHFHVTASSAVVNVSTVPQLQAAVTNLTSGQEIRIAAGRYGLTQQLRIGNGVTNVALIGATGNRDDVVIVGSGMNTPGVDIAIKVENAQDVRIANLSVGEAYWHPIQLQGELGAERVRVSNVRLFNAGQQFLKSTVDYAGALNGVDDVIVENSLIEFTVIGPPAGYTEGIDVHHGANWIIRNNVFRNFRVPAGATFVNRPCVLMWGGSRNTTVTGNTFINCERAIIFGQGGQAHPGTSHSGGLIVNNFIYRTEPQHADAGISVWDSPGTRVYHNTIIQNGTYPAAIEYRFSSTTGVEIINNLTDGLILQRDNASALVANNYTTATPALFVNAAAGDLHLRATAAVAIDQGRSIGVQVDRDGDARPTGTAPDLGADEWIRRGTMNLERASCNLHVLPCRVHRPRQFLDVPVLVVDLR